MRPSSTSTPGRAAVAGALGLLLLVACQRQRIELPKPRTPAFDPTRWDAGPEPDDATPLPYVVRFGITPFYSAERQAPMLARLKTYLEAEMGMPVETVVSPSYEACVERLLDGDLHAAQLSPFAYALAKVKRPSIEALATAVANGSTTYASYLIVRSGSPVRTIDAMRGRTLGLVDRWSTSGFIAPRAWLRARGLDIEEDFEVRFFGSHDATLNALLDGSVEMAALSSDTLLTNHVVGIGGPVRILAKVARIPVDAIVVRDDIPPRLRYRLRKAFLRLSIHSEKGRRVLENYNLIRGFMPVPEGHYAELIAIARADLEKTP